LGTKAPANTGRKAKNDARHRASGRGEERQVKTKQPWMEPGLQELVALAGLAAFGSGLALQVGDLLFAAIFVAAYS
jgi:hypothetical protein